MESTIVVGSSRSVCGTGLGRYVDIGNHLVVRVNRKPNPDFANDYGSKTDIFFGCPLYEKFIRDMGNRVIIPHRYIIDISNDFMEDTSQKWLTTGFIAILMTCCFSKHTEILGFGNTPDKIISDGNGGKSLVTYSSGEQRYDRHDLDFEHRILKVLHD